MNDLRELLAYIDGLKIGIQETDKTFETNWYTGFCFAITSIENKGIEILKRGETSFVFDKDGMHISNGGVALLQGEKENEREID